MSESLPAQAPPTQAEARAEAGRLLRAAEHTLDRELMARYTELAQSWINLASLDEAEVA